MAVFGINFLAFLQHLCVLSCLLIIVECQNAETDVAGCSCDLTVNACDINCCCDLECDEYDKQTFSACVDEYTPPDSRACVRKNVIIRDNVPYETETTVDGLFCIYDDNFEKRNYYELPNVINDTEQFDDYKNTYGNYGYQKDVINISLEADFYMQGDVIYTVYNSGTLGVLGQPSALTSAVCVDSNPASFLTPKTTECTRELSSLEQDCMTNLMLDASIYYTGVSGYKVISTPAAFRDFPIYPDDNETMPTALPDTTPAPTLPTTASPILDLDPLYNSTYALSIEPTVTHVCIDIDGLNTTCGFTGENLPSPTYDLSNGVCSNAVVKVKYIVTQNATDGIVGVEVEFTFREVTNNILPLTQAFETQYLKLGETGAVALSGNPGYDVGMPMLAGTQVEYVDNSGNARVAIEVSTDPLNGLTILTSGVNGECKNLTDPTTSNRVTVTFGEDLRSGCFIKESYTDLANRCELLQQTALDALRGTAPPNRVATFGNSSTEITGDWVEVIEDSLPSTSIPIGEDTCRDMVTGMHWEIMYASVGSVDNPQAKVIGVAIKYTVQDIKYQCYGAYCQPANQQLTQMFEVVSSVEFIDASRLEVGETAKRPTISARLPEDFFYPFT